MTCIITSGEVRHFASIDKGGSEDILAFGFCRMKSSLLDLDGGAMQWVISQESGLR